MRAILHYNFLFSHLSIFFYREDHVSQKIYIQLKNPEKENIVLTLETRDSNELILVLSGYYRLLCLRDLEIERDEIRDESLIPYCSRHQVTCQGWNYPHNNDSDCLHYVNFGAHPPYQPPPPGEILITLFLLSQPQIYFISKAELRSSFSVCVYCMQLRFKGNYLGLSQPTLLLWKRNCMQ